MHPSFAVLASPDGASAFRCLACNEKGTLRKLVEMLRDLNHKLDTLDEVEKLIRKKDKYSPSTTRLLELLARAKVKGLPNPPPVAEDKPPPPLPESELAAFEKPSGDVLEYLKTKRGLTQYTIDSWEIGWHPEARRIAVPIRDLDGKLVGISGRDFDGKSKAKWMHSTGFRSAFYIYGEHRCHKHKTGYLTEGFFDVIKLHQSGYNAFAIMGSSLPPPKMDKVLSFFTEVIIVPDGDAPGLKAAREIREQLTSRIACALVDIPEGLDPDDLNAYQMINLLGKPNLVDDDDEES